MDSESWYQLINITTGTLKLPRLSITVSKSEKSIHDVVERCQLQWRGVPSTVTDTVRHTDSDGIRVHRSMRVWVGRGCWCYLWRWISDSESAIAQQLPPLPQCANQQNANHGSMLVLHGRAVTVIINLTFIKEINTIFPSRTCGTDKMGHTHSGTAWVCCWCPIKLAIFKTPTNLLVMCHLYLTRTRVSVRVSVRGFG